MYVHIYVLLTNFFSQTHIPTPLTCSASFDPDNSIDLTYVINRHELICYTKQHYKQIDDNDVICKVFALYLCQF